MSSAPGPAAPAPPSINPAQHLRLVYHILKSVHLPPGMDEDDAAQEGMLALCQAARAYDPDRGTAWSGYAFPRIRGQLLDAIREHHRRPIPLSDLEDGELSAEQEVEAPPEREPGTGTDVALLLGHLLPREREAVELRYGLRDGEAHPLEEVGRRLGVSPQQASQLVQAGLARMRRAAGRKSHHPVEPLPTPPAAGNAPP